jgi:hypothetical protein
MSQSYAQICLTSLLLLAAFGFVLLDQQNLAVALIGAVAGQGASVAVRTAANGNGKEVGK